MRQDGVIITIATNQGEELEHLFRDINFLRVDQFEYVKLFREQDIIAVIIDIDNYKDIDNSLLVKFSKKYGLKFLFISSHYSSLLSYQAFGEVSFNKIEMITSKIIDIHEEANRLLVADYVLNYQTRTVVFDNQVFKLRNTPFLILCYLIKNKNKTCSREEILLSFDTKPSLSDGRTIDVHINYLRNTLHDTRIKTIVNEGYKYETKKNRP